MSEDDPPQLILRQDARGSLRELCMNRGARSALVSFDGYVSEKDCVTIFKALANLSSLEKLYIISSIIPVTALTAIISHPTCPVIHVNMDNVTLSSRSFADYMTLVETFRLCSLQSIECVELAYCDFNDQSITIEPFLRALSTIPTLERAVLSETKILPRNGSWNCQPLLQLLPQLRSLHIERMPDIQHEQICMLAEALERKFCTLRGLTIQNQKRMSEESLYRISQMLEVNTNLHELTIEVFCVKHVLWFVKALQNTNSNLKRLSFVGDWGLEETAGSHKELRKELLKMVQTHVKLEELDLGDDDHDLSKEMAVLIQMKIASAGGSVRDWQNSIGSSSARGLVLRAPAKSVRA